MKQEPGIVEYAIVLTVVGTAVIFLANFLPILCLSLCCLSPILIPVWFSYQKQIKQFYLEMLEEISDWKNNLD